MISAVPPNIGALSQMLLLSSDICNSLWPNHSCARVASSFYVHNFQEYYVVVAVM